jgi:GTPase SAR1 family protein
MWVVLSALCPDRASIILIFNKVDSIKCRSLMKLRMNFVKIPCRVLLHEKYFRDRGSGFDEN